ncbi:MAG: hypothetical protein QF824_00060 [Candidatus Woesearchaeota archaeon]|nr:hypothetical protein [Candidatus Woesearchaeota archaeon]
MVNRARVQIKIITNRIKQAHPLDELRKPLATLGSERDLRSHVNFHRREAYKSRWDQARHYQLETKSGRRYFEGRGEHNYEPELDEELRKRALVRLKGVFFYLHSLLQQINQLAKLVRDEKRFSERGLTASKEFEREISADLHIEEDIKADLRGVIERPRFDRNELEVYGFFESQLKHIRDESLDQQTVRIINGTFMSILKGVLQNCNRLYDLLSDNDPENLFKYFEELRRKRGEITQHVRTLIHLVYGSISGQEQALTKMLDDEREILREVEQRFSVSLRDQKTFAERMVPH